MKIRTKCKILLYICVFLSLKANSQEAGTHSLYDIMKEGISIVSNYQTIHFDDSIISSNFNFERFEISNDTIQNTSYFIVYKQNHDIAKISKRYYEHNLEVGTYDLYFFKNHSKDILYYVMVGYSKKYNSFVSVPHFFVYDKKTNINLMFGFFYDVEYDNSKICLLDESQIDQVSMLFLDKNLYPKSRIEIRLGELITYSNIKINDSLLVENIGLITNYLCNIFSLNKEIKTISIEDIKFISGGIDFPNTYLYTKEVIYEGFPIWFYYYNF